MRVVARHFMSLVSRTHFHVFLEERIGFFLTSSAIDKQKFRPESKQSFYFFPPNSGTYTSFISEDVLSNATRLSTLPGSGLKQGWSGFRIFPSSGMHICNHVSKNGVSPD